MNRALRCLALVVFSSMALGLSCQGQFCDNNVDGGTYGFTLTIPAEFACTNVYPNSIAIAQGRWFDATSQVGVSVLVTASDLENPGEDQGGYSVEELGEETNAHGITFQERKITLETQPRVYSYVAGTTLPNGNKLFITVLGRTDDGSMFLTLAAIVESVQFTQ